MKVYWVSRHILNEEQIAAIHDLFGPISQHPSIGPVEIVHDNIVFKSPEGLFEYCYQRKSKDANCAIFAVAGAIHYLVAMNQHADFYFFERDNLSTFRSIWHVYYYINQQTGLEMQRIERVWNMGYQRSKPYKRWKDMPDIPKLEPITEKIQEINLDNKE